LGKPIYEIKKVYLEYLIWKNCRQNLKKNRIVEKHLIKGHFHNNQFFPSISFRHYYANPPFSSSNPIQFFRTRFLAFAVLPIEIFSSIKRCQNGSQEIPGDAAFLSE
jgi:hypothetical protein